MWREDSERSSQCLQDWGRRGWWERKRQMREEKGVRKRRWESWTDEKHHHRSTVRVLIHNSQVVCPLEPQRKKKREKKTEKEEEEKKRIALFCFSAADGQMRSVWEHSSWATQHTHQTRDEHIQFAESRRCQRTSASTFSSCQLLSWDL